MKNEIPQTILELKIWMQENCYDFRGYSIAQNSISEGFGIEQMNNQYIWYYCEYSRKENLKTFNSQKEIVKFAYQHIKADKWAKAHCIGFEPDKNNSKKLAQILKNLDIEYFQDEIPYNGGPVFRTFVFGCDIKKVENLKSDFFKK